MNKYPRSNKKRVFTLLLLSMATTGLIVFGYVYVTQKNSEDTKKYPGTTEEEKKETEARKKQLVKDNEAKLNPPGDNDRSIHEVSPVITSANKIDNQVVVAAYVPGVFEDGGTCTMTATNNGQTVADQVVGFGNVSTTNCPPFRVDVSKFPFGGSWSVVVSYSSQQSKGVSQAVNLEL